MDLLGKKKEPKPQPMAFAMGVVIPQPPDALGRAQLTAIVQAGMTLRDYFAGQALSSFVPFYSPNLELEEMDDLARTCYAMADNMLEIGSLTSEKG